MLLVYNMVDKFISHSNVAKNHMLIVKFIKNDAKEYLGIGRA